jgi:hypothetical protein
MKKREVKEIEKEKEKSRIERESHFKKPQKKEKRKKVTTAAAGQTWAAYNGAAHHQPCTQCMCAGGRGRDNFKM